MSMSKKERVFNLTILDIGLRSLPAEPVLAVADCIMAMPEGCIPDYAGMREFVGAFINYFLGASNSLATNYPKAARWTDKWKRSWTTKEACRTGLEEDEVSPWANHPSAMWTTNDALTVVSVSGGALRHLKTTPKEILGSCATRLFGGSLGAALQKALDGEPSLVQCHHGLFDWAIAVSPRFALSKLIGTDGTAAALESKKRIIRVTLSN
jgi:hypothetical protein